MMVGWFLMFLVVAFQPQEATAGHGLLSRQSDCKIRCQNGGMCAFDLDRPDIHSCICLLGLYHGDRCQFRVDENRDVETTTVRKTTVDPRVAEEAARVENEARRRAYEKEVEEKSRREKDEAERRRQHEEYWTKRREEERRKQQEEHEKRRQQEEADGQRRREHEQAAERRRVQEEQDRRRQQEEQENQRLRQEEEQRRRQQEEMNRFQPTISDEEAEISNQEWDYENDAGDDYLNAPKDGEIMEEKRTDGLETSIDPEESQDSGYLDTVKKIINTAAEQTLEQHPIEDDEEDDDEEEIVERKPEEDDYWEHTPRRTDEDYALDSVQSKPKDEEAYGMEEGEDGWMMVKKDSEQTSTATLPVFIWQVILTTIVTLLL